MSQHSSRGASWKALRAAVLERDGHICHWCAGPATEADHLIPKSQGGRDTMDNLVASCKPCNARRGDNPIPLRVSGFNPKWLDGLW